MYPSYTIKGSAYVSVVFLLSVTKKYGEPFLNRKKNRIKQYILFVVSPIQIIRLGFFFRDSENIFQDVSRKRLKSGLGQIHHTF